jgi:16S rRNA C967 or C1407 C5-methylase (RsmB/RsmF family)
LQEFLRDTPSFRITSPSELPSEVAGVISEDGFLRCLPHLHDMDGFFAVRLTRGQ